MKRLIAICLSAVILFTVIPLAASAGLTEDEVRLSLLAKADEFYEGMPWTNDNHYIWYGLPDIIDFAGGCAAFAYILSDAAFGSLPAREVTDIDYDAIRTGDIIRLKGDSHSVVILYKYDNYVIVAEGNFNSSIHWGRTLSKAEILAADYYYTRYPEQAYVPDDAAIESIRDFVERCYRLILGRESDEAGLNNWVNALLFNTADASQIISGFMNSEEFGNQQKDNSETVEILYNTMLNRPSDTAGKEYWVDVMNNSNSNAVINGFCGSREFLSLCQEYGIEAGSVPVDQSNSQPQPVSEPNPKPRTADIEKIKGFIHRCYDLILARDADEGGLNNWVNVLSSGASNASQIVSGFMGSEEYTNNNYSSAETIEVLYNTMLGRPSDPAGKQYWIDVLYSQGINAVIEGFRSSQEFSIICNDYGITP